MTPRSHRHAALRRTRSMIRQAEKYEAGAASQAPCTDESSFALCAAHAEVSRQGALSVRTLLQALTARRQAEVVQALGL